MEGWLVGWLAGLDVTVVQGSPAPIRGTVNGLVCWSVVSDMLNTSKKTFIHS